MKAAACCSSAWEPAWARRWSWTARPWCRWRPATCLIAKGGPSRTTSVSAASIVLAGRSGGEFVDDVATRLRLAFVADYVVLGGGNSRLIKKLPPEARLGKNENAFLGGFRLWEGCGDAKVREQAVCGAKLGIRAYSGRMRNFSSASARRLSRPIPTIKETNRCLGYSEECPRFAAPSGWVGLCWLPPSFLSSPQVCNLRRRLLPSV